MLKQEKIGGILHSQSWDLWRKLEKHLWLLYDLCALQTWVYSKCFLHHHDRSTLGQPNAVGCTDTIELVVQKRSMMLFLVAKLCPLVNSQKCFTIPVTTWVWLWMLLLGVLEASFTVISARRRLFFKRDFYCLLLFAARLASCVGTNVATSEDCPFAFLSLADLNLDSKSRIWFCNSWVWYSRVAQSPGNCSRIVSLKLAASSLDVSSSFSASRLASSKSCFSMCSYDIHCLSSPTLSSPQILSVSFGFGRFIPIITHDVGWTAVLDVPLDTIPLPPWLPLSFLRIWGLPLSFCFSAIE